MGHSLTFIGAIVGAALVGVVLVLVSLCLVLAFYWRSRRQGEALLSLSSNDSLKMEVLSEKSSAELIDNELYEMTIPSPTPESAEVVKKSDDMSSFNVYESVN